METYYNGPAKDFYESSNFMRFLAEVTGRKPLSREPHEIRSIDLICRPMNVDYITYTDKECLMAKVTLRGSEFELNRMEQLLTSAVNDYQKRNVSDISKTVNSNNQEQVGATPLLSGDLLQIRERSEASTPPS